ncbi:hypothetical protein BDV26DRAFT_299190 [Aspergillus bertholletiae]|uniref:Apple domain-containing protein n=1 Tax=Aspergillus bertholletiae TaxID=1226010 RepID=A0A5N7AM67_9EURO|nr:hypothetical protein BDV26DRAFT_299190 [Aspergillus bertholletiae]
MDAAQDPLIFNTKALNPSLGVLEYNRICPYLDGTIAEVAPGYMVRFHCDIHPPSNQWDRHWIEGLSSIEECAELCESRDDCQASFWKRADGTCWIGHTRELANRPVPGYVFMVPLEHSTAELERCRTGRQECEDNKIQLEADLRGQCEVDKLTLQSDLKGQCGADKSQLELDLKRQCEVDKSQLESDFKELDKKYKDLLAKPKGPHSGPACRANLVTSNPGPADDGCVFTLGGAKFKVYYTKLNDPGNWDIYQGGIASFKACADMCADKSNCARFAWHSNNAERWCWLRSHGGAIVPSATSPWSSFHRVY